MEDPDDGVYCKARIPEQLSRTGDPGEIDDAFEVGGATRAKLPGQMFPADAETAGKGRSSHGSFDLAEQHIPCGLLQRLCEPQHPWRIDQSAPSLRRDRRPQDEIAHHGIVYPFHQHGRDRVDPARQEQLAVIGAERRVRDHRNGRKVGTEIGQCGQQVLLRRENDCVHKTGLKQPVQGRRTPA